MTSEEPSAEVEDEEAKQRRQVELDKYRRAKAHRNEVKNKMPKKHRLILTQTQHCVNYS